MQVLNMVTDKQPTTVHGYGYRNSGSNLF